MNRVAHLKQLRGEHQWVVTPADRRQHRLDASTDRPTDVPTEEVAA